jgi:hypothetical protein
MGDAAPPQLGAAHAQRRDGARHRRLAERTGDGDPLAEPYDAAERVDDAEGAALPARDQQAAIVGAEIDGGVDRSRVATTAPVSRRGWPSLSAGSWSIAAPLSPTGAECNDKAAPWRGVPRWSGPAPLM